jgi:hypothetical protein
VISFLMLVIGDACEVVIVERDRWLVAISDYLRDRFLRFGGLAGRSRYIPLLQNTVNPLIDLVELIEDFLSIFEVGGRFLGPVVRCVSFPFDEVLGMSSFSLFSDDAFDLVFFVVIDDFGWRFFPSWAVRYDGRVVISS